MTSSADTALRRRAAVAVALLTLLAFALRLWGIDHLLPHTREPDSHMALHVELLRQGADSPDPRNNDNQYPIVLPWLLSRVPSSEAPLAERRTLGEHLDAAQSIYLETRIEMALFSVLLVPLTYALARRFLTRGWSLFAGALLATSFLLQFFAQQARPHAAAAAFFLAAVLTSMRLARAPTWGNYALAALASAVSIGVLHSGLATLVPLSVASALGVLRVVHEPARKLVGRLALVPVLAVAVAAVAIYVGYPYLRRDQGAGDFDRVLLEGGGLVWGDHRVALADFRGVGFVTVARTLWFYEPSLTVLTLAALAAWAARKLPIYRALERWSDFWVAVAFAAPYLIAIGLFERTFERFAIPLLPFLATFAAWGLSWWCERLARGARRAIVAAAVLALALPAFACARLAWLRAGDDTLERAAQWLAAQPDAAETPIYVAPFFDLPLARSRESLHPSDGRPAAILSRWSIYQRRVGPDVVPPPRFDLRYLVPRPDLGFPMQRTEDDPEGYLTALGPGYFVLEVSRQPARPAVARFRETLQRRGELVLRSAPESAGPTAMWSLDFEDELLPDWPNVIARTLRVEALGPVVEVYRVR